MRCFIVDTSCVNLFNDIGKFKHNVIKTSTMLFAVVLNLGNKIYCPLDEY